MRPPSRRRLLVVLLVLTVVALVVDVSGGPAVGLLRSGGGVALGPLERVLSLHDRQDLVAAQRAREQVVRDQTSEQSVAGQQLQTLMRSPDLAGSALIPARIVAVGR